MTIKEIVRRTGYSRRLARKVLCVEGSDVFRIRESSLEAHLPWLDAQWAIGRRNGAEGVVTLRRSGRGFSQGRWLSGRRNGIAPRVHRRGAEHAVCWSGDKMALSVEWVVDGGVTR